MALAYDILERLLRWRGYRALPVDAPPRGFENFLAMARRNGFTPPRTVIDIGVGFGTPWLYDAFPDAQLHLFEALDKFSPVLERLAAERGAKYELCALGDRTGEIEINIPTVATGASILERTSERAARMSDQITRKVVRLERLDNFTFPNGPCLIKIDVEGAELKVLSGAVETLRKTGMVILEASVQPRHAGEADFCDIAAFMKAQGFRLYEIIEMSQEGRGGPLVYLDAAFIRQS